MPVIKNAALKDYAYYKTGGFCDVLYAPSSVEELAANVREIKQSQKPYFLLGGGTNSLVLDEPFPGAVIIFTNLSTLSVSGMTLRAGAGADNTAVARLALAEGLAGVAWMNRLPGQVGGTVRMNARCYGGEISQVCTRVRVVTKAGEIASYADPMIFRGYKDTIFMTNGDLIAEAELKLVPGDKNAIAEKMRLCEDDRIAKGQFDYPSCGCVFKNDYKVGVSSGLLLDTAGGKSLRRGGAEVSPHHANFIYNKAASSREILELSFAMRELVYRTYGVWMEYEMEVLGAMPDDLKERFYEVRPSDWVETKLEPLRRRMRSS